MAAVMDRRLHVAINAQLVSGESSFRRAGVHGYIHSLVRHIGEEHLGLRVSVLTGRSSVVPEGECTVVRTRWPTGNPPLRIVWEQAFQPAVLRKIDADVVHGTVYVGPAATRRPTVITLHDLSFFRHPELLRSGSRLYLRTMTRLSARRCRRAVAVSRHTAREASSLLGLPSDRIDVVYHGVDGAFRPLPAPVVADFRHRHSLPDKYVLFLGTLEPRKNLVRLAQGFARAGIRDHHLVLAGARGWGYGEISAGIEKLGLGSRIVYAGYVADHDLPALYNGATVFAYPSLYEGFGMPVLEAMACGTPVLTSSVSSLPEVAGAAARMVNPLSVEEIATGLAELASDPALREELHEKGLAQAGHFDWKKAARETAQVYRRAAGGIGA